jgi:hypothetical protein
MAQLPTVTISGVGDVYARLYGVHTESWMSPDAPCPKDAAKVETYIMTLPFAIGAVAGRALPARTRRVCARAHRSPAPRPPPRQAACRTPTRTWA